jgi:hypothetical protein
MRIKIDAVVDFKDRTVLPSVDPNTFVERGLLSLLKVDEAAFIEPGTRCTTTLLGPEGTRMWRPPSKRRRKRAA